VKKNTCIGCKHFVSYQQEYEDDLEPNDCGRCCKEGTPENEDGHTDGEGCEQFEVGPMNVFDAEKDTVDMTLDVNEKRAMELWSINDIMTENHKIDIKISDMEKEAMGEIMQITEKLRHEVIREMRKKRVINWT